jgi:hypothetical protein
MQEKLMKEALSRDILGLPGEPGTLLDPPRRAYWTVDGPVNGWGGRKVYLKTGEGVWRADGVPVYRPTDQVLQTSTGSGRGRSFLAAKGAELETEGYEAAHAWAPVSWPENPAFLAALLRTESLSEWVRRRGGPAAALEELSRWRYGKLGVLSCAVRVEVDPGSPDAGRKEDLVRFLLEAGLDPRARDYPYRKCALDWGKADPVAGPLLEAWACRRRMSDALQSGEAEDFAPAL